MKKMILLAVAIVSFAAVTSCSNNDGSTSLQGKWENFKLGTVTNGQETLTDYVPAIGCTKNYAIINANLGLRVKVLACAVKYVLLDPKTRVQVAACVKLMIVQAILDSL
jgi:hypothetical protein